MKVHCQKFIAVLLVVVLSVPVFMAPASAAYVYSPSVSDGNAFRLSVVDTLSSYAKVLGYDVDFSGFFTFSFSPDGVVTRAQLKSARDQYNSVYSQWLRNYGLAGALISALIGKNEAYISPDPVNGIERLRIRGTNNWVFDDYGRFPYRVVSSTGDVPATSGSTPATVPDTSTTGTNKWVKYTYFPPSGVSLYMSSKTALDTAAMQLKNRGEDCSVIKTGGYYVIAKQALSGTSFWCDKDGRPYVASPEPSVTNNDFNIIVDNSKNNSDNVTVEDMKVIDTQNNQMTLLNEFGDKITYNIDSLYWDASTSSYVANTYNYDITNNTYNYYTWNITYNITNTYINYIGSNSAYEQEEYKYYYELPDGRSSEDLTVDEVGALSFQFADVKNYARSATDTSLRALYHFDGNVEDSGYFSTQTAFNWTSGASITYMDSSSFNGALYLDETAHKFDISLPSNIGSGDFSLQFRHYQASQPDTLTNIENTLSIGGNVVLRWDERNFYWGASGSTVAAVVPIGSWAEIALIRNNGVLYLYINGLKVTSSANTVGYSGSIAFNFGSTSRAYTMLDELRFVNFAVATAGVSYQCATVPYDTNLVLVLPDSAFPIADEYFEVTYPTDAFGKIDLAQGAQADFPTTYVQSFDGYSIFMPGNSIAKIVPSDVPDGTNYYVNVVFQDGSVSALPFKLFFTGGYMQIYTGSKWAPNNLVTVGSFDWGSIEVVGSYDNYFNVWVRVSSGKSVGVSAMCVIKGTPATAETFAVKKVSCVYSSDDIKPNTAAVQSSIPVTGYTVGGVRPTFPERGNVWFPVESSRITGCYIYDGSMWRVSGCRYYTGSRWIPIYAFDIYTLADCWDVADAIEVTPPITSESGFWNWWKTEWTSFRAWLKEAFAGLSGGSGGGDTIVIPPDSTSFPNIPGEDGEENEEGWSIFDIVKNVVDALWKLLTGVFKVIFGGVAGFFFDLVLHINDFFDAFKGDTGVFGFAKYGGANIWD
ncbi:exported hypothetical protein [uncultured Eubacteriales bacterium]|uniref:Uncharacterized protein n=1 Tax=uncultured Eubacteriales bacterium TaxID=172733 RepID=A0A212JHT4_9FIRM|nr:exported hypothetical protein [uncultured Eubacteriales bacterium]